jgi:hypothetical protein
MDSGLDTFLFMANQNCAFGDCKNIFWVIFTICFIISIIVITIVFKSVNNNDKK